MAFTALTAEHIAGLFLDEDAADGRALYERLPVRVFRVDEGRDLSTALVAVGALNVTIEMSRLGPDGRPGPELDLTCWCEHDGTGWCAHAAAAMIAVVERDEPFGVGRGGSASGTRKATAKRPAVQEEPWERALRPLLAPPLDGERADAPAHIALLFAVRGSSYGEPEGEGVAIRPAVRGASGQWVRSQVTWRDVAGLDDPDPRWRALADVEALHASRANFPAVTERMRRGSAHRGYAYGDWSGAPEWIRLDAVPARGLWELLQAAHDAGVEFVADDREQAEIAVRQTAGHAVLDLRLVRGRLWVDPVIVDPERPAADDVLLPVGAPTVAVARVVPATTPTRPARSRAGATTTRIDALMPLEHPATAEFDRLQRKGRLSVPGARIADFANEYLPALRDVAQLVSSDDSFEVPERALPELVLAIRHADPVARLFWEWEYPPGERRDAEAERDLLDEVERAAGRFAHLLRRGRADRILPARDLDRDETVEFLAHVLPGLRGVERLRIEAHDEVPAYEFATEDPVIAIGADPSGQDWFELNIVVTIQGEPASSSELLKALSQGRTYFRLMSGTVFPLTGETFARLRDVLTEAKALADRPSDVVKVSRYQADLWQELAEVGVISTQETAWLEAMKGIGEAAVEHRATPDGLRAGLRGYQQEGFSWLDFLRRHRLGGILADDMGLGKTVQVLAALEQARVDEPGSRFLVVTPTSVVGHWVREAERFAPELAARAIGETSAKRGTSIAEAVGDAALVVTSYAILRLDADELQSLGFRVLVLDEAQNVKNASSRGYAAARALEAPTKFAVTGTPMENNLGELFALSTLVAPGLFGTRAHFREHFQRAIEHDDDRERLERLRARIRPFLLRRTKEQVAPELPPKTERTIEVALHAAHQRAYERRFRREQQKLLGLLDDVKKNQVQILAALTTLRRHALDPTFAEADGPSAKLEALGGLFDEVVADGHRVLVFSQFTEFLGMAARVADERGIRYAYLDGSTSQRRRQMMIDRFSSGEVPVFFVSLKAGGTGLNLTAADYCILLDPWWNPAAEAQAIDRAHRIGQQKPVMVYRLISAGTIEQKVVELQERKRRLFEDVLGGAEGIVDAGLSADDFRALLE